MALLIWQDWDGDLFAFCSRECLTSHKTHVTDPSDLHEKATSTEHSFGCWWCGGDLSQGVTWLPKTEAQDPESGIRNLSSDADDPDSERQG
ncbi:hypothetical protein LCGC14_1240330 [marine sediment metagenome]|uniref:MYM-type domain-containing protein n=1 Tax=marine sediment metagenome TaxID=412755 RepID=A0A0F9LA85_9ZZZZ